MGPLDADALWDLYTRMSTEEPLGLEEFVARAASGGLGEATPPWVLERFLRRVEAMMLANIETKSEEAPYLQGMKEEAIERTQAMINELVARYVGGATP